MSVFRISALFMIAALSGCNGEEKGSWRDASRAQEFLAQGASQEALREKTVDSLPRDCEDLLPAARSALEEPGAPALRVLIQACSEDSLGFGGELRCLDGTLQVRCL